MKVTKVLAVFAAIALSAVTTHAKVGTHNGFITLNGGFNYGKGTFTKYAVDNIGVPKGSYMDQLGGALGFDIGYQYYSPTKLIHGADAVIGMNAGFERTKGSSDGNTYEKADAEIKKTGAPTLVGYVSSTYSLGFQAVNTRFMFDVLGLQLAFGQLSQFDANADPKSEKTDTIFNVGLNLPLGFRAVMDNGFIIGFRHTLAFNCVYKNAEKDGQIVGSMLGDKDNRNMNLMQYSMMFSIGFAFGK